MTTLSNQTFKKSVSKIMLAILVLIPSNWWLTTSPNGFGLSHFANSSWSSCKSVTCWNWTRRLEIEQQLKYRFCKKLLQHKWTSDQFTEHFFSWSALIWTKNEEKMFNRSEVRFYLSNLLQNPCFRGHLNPETSFWHLFSITPR